MTPLLFAMVDAVLRQKAQEQLAEEAFLARMGNVSGMGGMSSRARVLIGRAEWWRSTW